MLFQSGRFRLLTNPAFVLGLFHPTHTPNKHFCNKFTSPLEYTPDTNLFLGGCLLIDEIDLSHKIDPKNPNGVLRDYCMCHNVKI